MLTPRPRCLLRTHFRVADEWARAILSNPAIVAPQVHGEKGGAEIEAPLSIHPTYYGALRLACFPKFSNPVRSGICSNQSRRRFFIEATLNEYQHDSTRQLLNRSRRLKRSRSFSVSLQSSVDTCEAREPRQDQLQPSFHSVLNPFGG